MRRILCTTSLLFPLLLAACGSGLEGTYAINNGMGELSYQFKSNGTVMVNMMGIKSESRYELDGNTIKIATPNGNAILTRIDDQTIEAAMGVKLIKKP